MNTKKRQGQYGLPCLFYAAVSDGIWLMTSLINCAQESFSKHLPKDGFRWHMEFITPAILRVISETATKKCLAAAGYSHFWGYSRRAGWHHAR
ncbi:hypothetical protein [Butyricicoccus porcorum]|uniref:hypothetical protein n=1 Tax=Butyricicoccus porcorum TaxID=1945634 RepID=UPI00105458A2|nr:hypothetical protein [Butyricicoccus porcorum]